MDQSNLVISHNKSFSIDDVILNLKIISSIKQDDKLTRNQEDHLTIENKDLLQGARRWWNSNSRAETIAHIKNIIRASFDITDTTIEQELMQGGEHGTHRGYEEQGTSSNHKKTYFNEGNSCLLQRFVLEMTNAIRGLDNLKYTYKNDVNISSEIDILKEQLEIRTQKINSLLKIESPGHI